MNYLEVMNDEDKDAKDKDVIKSKVKIKIKKNDVPFKLPFIA